MNSKIKSVIRQASFVFSGIVLSTLGAAVHAGESEERRAARSAAADLACETARSAAQQPWREQINNAIKSGDSKAAGYAGCRYSRDGTLACQEAARAVLNLSPALMMNYGYLYLMVETLPPCE